MNKLLLIISLLIISFGLKADTTDSKWKNIIELKKLEIIAKMT